MNSAMTQADISHIAAEGSKIYGRIRSQYEPAQNGQFLAIEVESGKVYLAATSPEAVALGKKEYADKMFYVVKVGYDAVATLAATFLQAPRIS